MAITLPIVLLLIDYLKSGKITGKDITYKIPFLILSIVIGFVTIDAARSYGHITGMESTFSLFNRLFILSYSISLYLLKFFFPVKLSAIYGFPEVNSGTLPLIYYLSGILIAGLTVLAWKSRKLKRELVFSFLFFLVTIAPVLPLFWSRIFMAGERYVYLPYLGLLFICALVVDQLFFEKDGRHKKFNTYAIIILLVFGIFFSISTNKRSRIWVDPETLMTDVIDKSKSSNTRAAAFFYRGNIRDKKQDFNAAMSDFDQSLKLNTDNFLAYNNRGIVRGIMQDYQGAMQDFNKATELKPDYADAFYNRGIVYYQLNAREKACEDWKKADKLGAVLAKEALVKYCDGN
jgi:hypothetical protein